MRGLRYAKQAHHPGLCLLWASEMICPLLSSGIMANRPYRDSFGSVRAWSYAAYVSNPTPNPISAKKIIVWVIDDRDDSKALKIDEEIPRTVVPGGKTLRVEFQDAALSITQAVGSSIECGANL